ncbi:MAG: TetR/AcrR family transcriptional regulator [Ignavibacteriaceae bacterium]|nr:TetR/AcrR family transcriptional regulator [Ignavibacteriaceae bacterium]
MARLTTEERQRVIIDEAINIIHESGYGALSIRELASRVKISEPAIYRHFLNKEDIVLGILSRISGFDEELQASIEKEVIPRNKLRAFILFHFDFLEKNRSLTSVMFSEEIFTQSPVLKENLMKLISQRRKQITDIIMEMDLPEKLHDFDKTDLSKIIMGFIRMTVLEWKLGNFSTPLIPKGEKITRTFESLIFK